MADLSVGRLAGWAGLGWVVYWVEPIEGVWERVAQWEGSGGERKREALIGKEGCWPLSGGSGEGVQGPTL